ncbi:CAZyme family PL7 [Trichoderma aggressivum f. europaeum]|uniref:CAZyme family PL7 n=1 Tax=Trichoderma aggressivum f. europaeum TaxID=173218 RepID=A0AAE1LX97_9HYPO|nr:CAZyme family PL7 [Trichoderma aggressivum f. europaeum]
MLASKSNVAMAAIALFFSSAAALDPTCAPGGNFDLSRFVLQLPSGTTNKPDQIPASQLASCSGYQDPGHHYFFTESGDGALVMKAPGGGRCAYFSGAPRCRSELGETASWSSTAAVNRLTADLLVTTGSSICIGQVFQSNSNNKPLAEVYYSSSGQITVGVEYVATGGQGQDLNKIGTVTPGSRFHYEMRFENGQLQFSLNGGAFKTLKQYFTTSRAFFKVGNYNQGSDDSDIHVFGLTVSH